MKSVIAAFRSTTIKTRLWVVVVFTIACIIIIQAIDLQNIYQAQMHQKEEEVHSQVDNAHSLLAYFYKQSQSGLAEAEAKSQAINAIRELRYKGNEYFWINDTSPTMIMHPFKPQLEGQSLGSIKDPNGVFLFNEMIKVTNKNGSGFVNYMWPKPGKDEPQPKLSFVALFEPWDWIIGTGIYTDDVFNSFKKEAINRILITLAFLLILITILYIISRSIGSPLAEIARAMNDIATGEGDLTQRLPVDGNDEVTHIAISFNDFIKHMQALVRESKESTRQLATLAQQITEASSQTRELTEGQRQKADQVATGSKQLSHSIQEVAANADQEASANQDVSKSASTGQASMAETLHHISDLATNIEQSRQVIQSLKDETASIGKVLDVIRSIAEQTNLLALNAAIEAARAGEQGRGFAVVADEVRTLASRTQQSTEEIDHMISRLQDQAANAVDSMEQNVKTSETTAEISQQSMETIASINNAVHTITEMNLCIARAVEEQNIAAQDINASIIHVADSSELITNKMRDVESFSQQLTDVSNTMVNQASRFQV
ncbi:MAG: methyl-accepting chemotaxis protein [Reinekea sp.]